MTFYADIHVHSKYSRATSRDCDLEHLFIWGRRKGISVVGTGDFTHPGWREELLDKLVTAEPGLYRLRPELERAAVEELPNPAWPRSPDPDESRAPSTERSAARSPGRSNRPNPPPRSWGEAPGTGTSVAG